MKPYSLKISAVLLSLIAGVGLSAAPAVAVPTDTVRSVQAELAGWKKPLLNQKQVIALSGISPQMIDLARTYSNASTYSKTWVGEREETGMSSVIVQISKMPSKGWDKSVKAFADGYGYSIDKLSDSIMKGSRPSESGMQSYAVLRNAGDYVVVIEYAVPAGTATDAESYVVAERLAAAQKKQLNAAGYGS